MDSKGEATSSAVCNIAYSIRICQRNTVVLCMSANQPNADASIVAIMRMAGALILGKFVR